MVDPEKTDGSISEFSQVSLGVRVAPARRVFRPRLGWHPFGLAGKRVQSSWGGLCCCAARGQRGACAATGERGFLHRGANFGGRVRPPRPSPRRPRRDARTRSHRLHASAGPERACAHQQDHRERLKTRNGASQRAFAVSGTGELA